MAKSQDTYSKKEKEKKRLKKRQDKEEKKKERKLNPKAGEDDMIAYVDEFGVITSTPPDRTRKIDIKQEDIQIGISRKTEEEEEDPVHRGKVTFFNDSKGYGFIKDTDSQQSFFVHVNGLAQPIAEGDKVTFEVENGPKGPVAVKVTKTA